jgi:Protein of unknown function (DUF561)
MSNRTTRLARLDQALASKTLVKTIAGIDNTNLADIQAMAQAAEQSGVVALDMSADATLVATVRAEYTGVLFASSVLPSELAAAIEAGADVAELGNYDALYKDGLFLTADEVFQLARATKAVLPAHGRLCVTIPGHLAPWTQAHLATELQALGVDMIQTEGASRFLSDEPQVAVLSAAQKAEVSLSNTRLLVQHTTLPIMSASGMTVGIVGQAIAAGASAVGIGAAVSSLLTVDERAELLRRIQAEVNSVVVAQPAAAAMSMAS